MKMAYNGAHAFVDVPAAGLVNVKRGEAVEIEDSHVRSQLSKQGWEYVHDEDENDKDGDDS